MRKVLLLFSLFCINFVPGNSQTDYKVSTDVQKKKVLLEEFTGIHCGNCPDGHKMARIFLNALPDQSYVVSIHAGHYSVPSQGEPDYRTAEGDSVSGFLDSEMAGYPCGSLNRMKFDEESFFVSRSYWNTYGQYIAKQDAPVNLYVESSYDGKTGKLTVHVEGYYTSDSPEGTQTLSVLWTQDDIIGPQNGGGKGDQYVHEHMLRDYITPVWGDTVSIGQAKKGQYFTKDYVYDLPDSVGPARVKPEDVTVVAFVTTDKADVENVEGGRPAYFNYNETESATLQSPDITIGTRYGYNFFEAYLKNTSGTKLTSATFDVTVNGQTETHTVECDIDQFSKGAITIPAKMSYADKGKTKYSIVLTQLNGKDVERDTISGGFQKPAVSAATVNVQILTDACASQNRFLLKDADGNVVKEFGPYENGKVATYDETATLEDGKTYCIEVTDSYGDGLLEDGKGGLIVHSGNGKLIDQFYSINGFGVRSFFTVDVAAGIAGVETDGSASVNALFSISGCRVYNAKTHGLYIVKGKDGKNKIAIK